MVAFLTELFLSPLLIFAVLFVIFIALSYWTIAVMHEYTGYVLGWLIGLFVVVVLASLGVEPDIQAQTVELQRATLSVLQVLCSGGIGLLLGFSAVVMYLLRLPLRVPRGVKVALITALWVTLLFLMFIVGIEVQRMIGIFALAFSIARVFGVVLAGGQLPQGLFALGDEAPAPGLGGGSAEAFDSLDAKRRSLFDRRQR